MNLSRLSEPGKKGSMEDFGQSLDTVRMLLGMDMEEDVATGRARRSLKGTPNYDIREILGSFFNPSILSIFEH